MDKTEKKILNEEAKIEKNQEKLLKEEKVVIKTLESKQFENLLEGGTFLHQLAKTRKGFIRKIAKHKFVFTLVVSFAIILVWRGIWEISASVPVLSSSIFALLLGVGILWLIERYTDLH